MLEKAPNNTQIFNSHFDDDIKDPCIDKTNKKSRSIVHAYND